MARIRKLPKLPRSRPRARAGSGTAKLATDLDRFIGLKVRLRRTELGMSQEALAERIGVARSQIVHYEAGANRITGSRLVRVAEALRVPVAYFLDQSTKGIAAVSSTLLTTPGAMSLIRAYAAIGDPRQRAALVNLARALAAAQKSL